MKKQLFLSLVLLAASPCLATDAPDPAATDVVAVCKCDDGCKCLERNDSCACDSSRGEDRDDREPCGGVCGRAVNTCDAGECDAERASA